MTQHLGKAIPSPALMEHIGTRFRQAVESYATSNGIPWVKFGKHDRKIDVMQPHLHTQAATGKSRVAAAGISQEFQRVWSAYQRDILRFEATVHNAKELRCRRGLDNLGEIITRLAEIADRFATAMDCADVGFLPDGIPDELSLPSTVGAKRTAGIDLNKSRIRAALAAAVALAPAPRGFTSAELAARVRQMTNSDGYTTRQAAYDLRKLRGKNLLAKPGGHAAIRSRRMPPAPSPRSSHSATT